MVNTLAMDAPRIERFDEKKIAQTCDSSRPAILINGNASLKMHCCEKSDNGIAANMVSFMILFLRKRRKSACVYAMRNVGYIICVIYRQIYYYNLNSHSFHKAHHSVFKT